VTPFIDYDKDKDHWGLYLRAADPRIELNTFATKDEARIALNAFIEREKDSGYELLGLFGDTE